jgi:2-polyprenyl-6-methoxyphenol hydroxylase-like FAD-dependent oxidoreductase
LRERDFLSALGKAVHCEENKGTIALLSGSRIDSVFEESKEPWSAPVVLKDSQGQLKPSERDYHLIIAAGGMNSVLRKLYGGHICSRGNMSDGGSRSIDLEPSSDEVTTEWHVTGQAEATGFQDRGYTVFRGNSPLSMKDLNMEKSFQTWGEGKSMRFATVPMISSIDGQRKEQQVWFITTDDEDIRNEPDPVVRKDKLLTAFADWHDPIGRLVESTPPESILMERALAHRHSMSPVANFNGILSRIRDHRPLAAGNGPAIVFVGDAFMTVRRGCFGCITFR